MSNKVINTLYPAHPTLWMVVLAPDPPFQPNPTGKADPASRLTATEASPVKRLLLKSLTLDTIELVSSVVDLGP